MYYDFLFSVLIKIDFAESVLEVMLCPRAKAELSEACNSALLPAVSRKCLPTPQTAA